MKKLIVITLIIVILVIVGIYFIAGNRIKPIIERVVPSPKVEVVEQVDVNTFSSDEVAETSRLDFNDENSFIFCTENLFNYGIEDYYGIEFSIKEDGSYLYYLDDEGKECALGSCKITFEPALENNKIVSFKGNDYSCLLLTENGDIYKATAQFAKKDNVEVSLPFKSASSPKKVVHISTQYDNTGLVRFDDDTYGVIEEANGTYSVKPVDNTYFFEDSIYRLLNGSYTFEKVLDDSGNEAFLSDYDLDRINYILLGGISEYGIDDENGARGFMINFERKTSFYQFIETAKSYPFKESQEISIDPENSKIILNSCDDFDYITYVIDRMSDGSFNSTIRIHGKDGFEIVAKKTSTIEDFKTQYEYVNDDVIEGLH